MDKPQPKRELAIDWYYEPVYIVHLYATPDAVEDVRQFGQVASLPDAPNLYRLAVDRRYDF